MPQAKYRHVKVWKPAASVPEKALRGAVYVLVIAWFIFCAIGGIALMARYCSAAHC